MQVSTVQARTEGLVGAYQDPTAAMRGGVNLHTLRFQEMTGIYETLQNNVLRMVADF